MKPFKIAGLLAVHEEKTGELYRIYAEKFRRHSAFWNLSADRQYARAAIIYRLRALAKRKIIKCCENGFNGLLVRDSITRIDAEKQRALDNKATSRQAFGFALELCMSVTAESFLSVFSDQKGILKHALSMAGEDAKQYNDDMREECLKRQTLSSK